MLQNFYKVGLVLDSSCGKTICMHEQLGYEQIRIERAIQSLS
jgi:hypothetical protein